MTLDLSTLPDQDQIAAIYIGYYDRAAEPQGSTFWEGAVANPDISLEDIADQFSTQDETLEVHPFFSDPTPETANAFITEVYLNLFNREPDADGLAFWSGVLLAAIDGTGDSTVGEIILQIIEGAQDGPDGNDRTTILNKIEVASSWTDAAEVAGFGDTAFDDLDADLQESAKTIIEPVTDSPATVVAAKEEIDDTFEPAPVPGDSFSLTSGTDAGADFTGTANDDEFNAYIQQNPLVGGISNSLSSADRLDGAAGNDRLYAEITNEFLGLGGGAGIGATDIQPRIKNIEEIDIEARDGDFFGGGFVTVDAKNITDHEEIGSYYSDGDLLIENVTTLLDGGAARDTADITITMDHTDNFNSDNDASDLVVYFDNDYLLAGETTVGQADFFLLDQDAELRLLTGGTAEGRLDEIDRNGIIFEIGDGGPVTIAFDEDLLNEDNPAEINTHDAFIAALQGPLQEAIANGSVPAGTQIVRFDYPNVIFDDDGLALNRAGLQDGSFSDLIPSVQVISGDGAPVTPLGYSFPTGIVGEFNVFGRFDQFADETPDPISIDIDLEKAGRGGEGGDLVIGGKAQNVNEGIADGIEVFNISVKGIGGDGALAKPSNVGTITSTGNELEVINIVTDPAYASGDSFASLVVRNGFDQNDTFDADGFLIDNAENGDLKLVNANGFLGNLTLGDIDANFDAGRITNLDTLNALGGGNVEFNALLDGNETDQAYTYLTGAGDDKITVRVDGDAVDYAGSSLNIQTGAGNDSVLVDFDVVDLGGNNEQLNQAVLDNVLIDTGAGNDTITIDDNAIGEDRGNANILAGAGDDTVYTDGAAPTGSDALPGAVWALNFDNARADAQGGIALSPPNDLPGVEESLAYVGGATVTVTLSGAGLANLVAGGGVMADANSAGGAIQGDDGYESRATVVVAGSNDYYGTQADVNRAVIEAINEHPTLGKLLVAFEGANNTVVVASLTSGDFAGIDLRVDIAQQRATNSAFANNVLEEAQSVFSNSDLTLTDLWGTTTFASPASYQAGAPAGESGDLTSSATANAWYDGLSVRGQANSADDNLHTAGSASTFEQDNIIDGEAGNDVIVLSTDATAEGVTPFTVSPNNALLNGASNQTISVTGDSIGNDIVMNFGTAFGVGPREVDEALDFIDLTSHLTSKENQTTAVGSESDVYIPVTLDTDLADLQANEVAVVTFDNTDDAAETFGGLNASVVQQLINNGAAFTGFNGDQNYGNLAASAANADDEYAENLPSTDDLIGGSAYSVLMIENADNDGFYKLFKVSWNGDASADDDSLLDGTATVIQLGSIDFGDSLEGFTEANLVGSDAYWDILEAGLNGNNGPVNQAPVFTSPTTANFDENTTAAYTAVATDADGDTVTYSISGGADSALFNINSSTGEVVAVGSGPDFETPADANLDNVYEIEVSATDGLATVSQSVAITVNDVVENGNAIINVDAANNAPTGDDTADETFVFADATYTATLTGFDPANDSLDFPDTGTDNLSLINTADDGEAQLVWVDGGSTISVNLVGLSSAEDLALTSLSGFDIV